VLPAGARIRRSEDFSLAVRRGRRAGSRTLVVHLLLPDPDPGTSSPTGTDAVPTPTNPRPTHASARVGLVVSRAVGPAVTRNRVKRRLRALTRERLGRLPERALLVVRAHPSAAEASSDVLAAELDRALDRALGRASRRPRPSGAAGAEAPS
jgi:ribonuclease P protein component